MAQPCFRGSAISSGLTHKKEWNRINKYTSSHSLLNQHEICRFRKELGYKDDQRSCHLSAVHRNSLWSPLPTQRKCCSPTLHSKLGSGFGVEDAEERITLNEQEDTARINSIATENVDVHELTETSVDVKRELIMLSLPAIAGQAIDPFAQLMETAYIGRYSSVALASAGVSVSIFNMVSKLFNIPLFSVATSFVAEDISRNAIENLSAAESTNGRTLERKQLSSVSTALLLAILIGIIEALALSLGSGLFLKLMGVPATSDMHVPAKHFLTLRALGAPAVAISLALQGIFRGFKDTQTPVFCLGVGNVLSIFFFPILMFGFRMGVTGAALSTVLSQYIVAFLLIRHLNKKVVLLPPKIGELQFGGYVKSENGFYRWFSYWKNSFSTNDNDTGNFYGCSSRFTAHGCASDMHASMACRISSNRCACNIWSGYLSQGDLRTVKEIANFVLKFGVVTGVSLAAILGVSFSSLATLFTQDAQVLAIVRTGVLFVSASQPINALAFIFDGLHYGVSDFPYAACSMMLLSAVSSAFLLFAPKTLGLRGVWLGLTLFMALRTTAGFVRILSKTGPWWFLHKDLDREWKGCIGGTRYALLDGLRDETLFELLNPVAKMSRYASIGGVSTTFNQHTIFCINPSSGPSFDLFSPSST
ncbi:MATE efflux family protein 3 [Hibiscus syriacus]|uniref:Protein DETOXIFICATION n=1 Tax=Hibiscus syriacus TaxID=106335 RepID=A0A6A2WU84_HIBSY|nr:MATE efflux family protein 3 [Hibiscus syriacus]